MRSTLRATARLALLLAVALGATSAAADDARSRSHPERMATPGSERPGSPYAIPYEKIVLDNGLEVILHQDASLPLVAVNVWYHVGPANEPEGRSGFAHLFEHLMFEGSRHVGREFDRLLESVGATNVNGTTSWDRTNYFETVPREHLELALWLESDRMGFMIDALTEDRLRAQQAVVLNERRQRYENAPYGPSDLALFDLLFPKGHPYHGAVIGSVNDISSATMEDVRSFFERYYAPSNATLAIAGDFEPEQVKSWVERYFTFPRSANRPVQRPERPGRPTPALGAEKRAVIEETVELGRVSIGWIAPPAFSEDDPALELAASVLAGGKATRLYQELVVRRKVASSVSAYVDSNALASIVLIEATSASAKSPEELEAAIDAVLAELSRRGPSDEELHRAKRGAELQVRSTLQLLNGGGGESGRTGLLQRFNHYLGNPGYLEEYMGRIAAVTPEAVRRAVARHLAPGRRAIVLTRPAASPAASSEEAP